MTGALGSKCIRRVFARLFLGSMDLNRALYPGGAHERTEVQARHEQLYGHTDLRKLELDATKYECTAMYCLHWYEFVGNQPFVEMYAFETTMRVGESFTKGVLLLSSTTIPIAVCVDMMRSIANGKLRVESSAARLFQKRILIGPCVKPFGIRIAFWTTGHSCPAPILKSVGSRTAGRASVVWARSWPSRSRT